MRGLAALVVVVAHCFQFFLPAAFSHAAPDHLGESALAMTPLNLAFNGGFAVCLFFVLSGFVLATPWFTRGDARWYAAAALKRYPRLALPAVASTLFAVFLAKTLGFHFADARAVTGATMPDFFSGIASWSTAAWQGLVGAFFFGEDTYNRVLWTIRVELIGSFAVFLLVPLLGRLRARWVAYLAIGAWTVDSFYFGFVVGVLIADVATMRPAMAWRARTWVPLALFAAWLGSYPYFDPTGSMWSPIATVLREIGEPFRLSHTLAAACLLVVALRAPPVQRALAGGVPRYLGRLSYAMYLVHFPLMASVGCAVVLGLSGAMAYPWIAACAFAACIAATIAVSHAFCRYVDAPVLRWCERLGAWALIRVSPARWFRPLPPR
jgi:peptidoglycan/LPS O-acetylase OafA/YrhL